MFSGRRLRNSFLWSLVGMAIFLAAIQFQAVHSDGFVFVRNKIESSSVVRSKLGTINQVHLPFFGNYSAHFGVSYTGVHLELHVVGSKGDAEFEVDAAKDDPVWQISRALMNGAQVSLQ